MRKPLKPKNRSTPDHPASARAAPSPKSRRDRPCTDRVIGDHHQDGEAAHPIEAAKVKRVGAPAAGGCCCAGAARQSRSRLRPSLRAPCPSYSIRDDSVAERLGQCRAINHRSASRRRARSASTRRSPPRHPKRTSSRMHEIRALMVKLATIQRQCHALVDLRIEPRADQIVGHGSGSLAFRLGHRQILQMEIIVADPERKEEEQKQPSQGIVASAV